MDKILIEVYLPAVNKSYDVYIPLRLKFFKVIELLAGAFRELSEDYFSESSDTVLCDKDTGTIFNINMSAEELGLKDGSKLMLI